MKSRTMAPISMPECTHSAPGMRLSASMMLPTDDVDRHAVAPGVVDRHRRVLQTDGAMARHGHRLAFDLGVALRHGDGDVLVHAGDDFGLVAGVIDDGFVQAAKARSAVDGEIFDAERLEHVDHEIAAAGRLIYRILDRRHRLRRHLPRTGTAAVNFCCGAAGIASAVAGGVTAPQRRLIGLRL